MAPPTSIPDAGRNPEPTATPKDLALPSSLPASRHQGQDSRGPTARDPGTALRPPAGRHQTWGPLDLGLTHQLADNSPWGTRTCQVRTAGCHQCQDHPGPIPSRPASAPGSPWPCSQRPLGPDLTELSYDPALALPGIYPEKTKTLI